MRPVSLALWRARLAYRRRLRNYWQHQVDLGRRGRANAQRELIKWQTLVRQAWNATQVRKPVSRQPITMYDSTDVNAVPADCVAFAGYVAGNDWPHNFDELRARFPHAKGASITLTASADADFLDMEMGGGAPDQFPNWVRRQWARGIKRPGGYAPESWWPAIEGELKRQGITFLKRRRIRRWVAHFDNVREIPPGDDGKQYATGAYDTSVVAWDFFD